MISSAIFMGVFIWGLKSTFAIEISPFIRRNSVERLTSTQSAVAKESIILNNTQNMSESTQMNYFPPSSPVNGEDGITISSNRPSDRALNTPSTASKPNISSESSINEMVTFDHSTSKYSRLTLEEASSSPPYHNQATALIHNKIDVLSESSDFSWRTNSQQRLESSFTTVISANGQRADTSNGNFHDLTSEIKVNMSSSLCIVSLKSKEGVITNRGYPYSYGDAEHCQWIVRLPHGPRIKVTFTDLDLEFDNDFLEISFGEEDEYHVRRYTGTKIPPASVLDTDQLNIVFKTDRDGHGRGFYIYFEETNEAPSFPLFANPMCSELSVSREGNFVTTGYPQSDYSNSEFCSWVIAAPANSVIRLEIEDFKTEIYDQLIIGKGLNPWSNTSSVLIRLFGIVDTPQETIIPANAIWLQFRTDESVTATGFNINYQIIERHICESREDFSASHGVLQSENYPQEYPINSECRWTIHGYRGSHIILHFLHFRLQDGHDFLLIGQGPDIFIGNFTQFTGRIEHAQKLRMKSNSIWLHFTSDHVRGNRFYSGFKIAYSIEKLEPFSLLHTSDTRRHVSNSIIQKHLSKEPETASDAMINGRAWNTSKITDFVVHLQGYSITEVETKRDSLLGCLVNVFVRFCQKIQENCLVRNEDIQLLTVVKDTSENIVKIYFTINFHLHKMTTSKRGEFQQVLDGTIIHLHSSGLKRASSEDLTEESALPSWLVAVIATVIFLVVVFIAMLLYSFLRSKKTCCFSKGSCQVSYSDQLDTTELEECNGKMENTSSVRTSASQSDDQKESKLSCNQASISIQRASIDLGNQEKASVSSCLDHKITIDTNQPSISRKETDHKALIPTKQNSLVPMENIGLCLEEVSTDL